MDKTEQFFAEMERRYPALRAEGRREWPVPRSGGDSLTDQIVESEALRRFVAQRQRTSDDIVVRGWVPEPGERFEARLKYLPSQQFAIPTERMGQLPFPTAPRMRMRDLMTVIGVDTPLIVFDRVTGYSNNAAGVAEGVAKPTSVIVSSQQTTKVSKIATFMATSREAVDDVDRLRQSIDAYLELFIGLEEDDEILNGVGLGGNELVGFLGTAGVQTTAVGGGTNPKLAAIRHAVTLVQTCFTDTGFEPNALVLHPTDAEELDLLLDGNNRYLLLPEGGPPTETPQRRIWNLPVVVTPKIAEGTGLVGDFRQAFVASLSPLTIRITDSHSDWFQLNKLAIVAEERLALAIQTPAAFCKVTGL